MNSYLTLEPYAVATCWAPLLLLLLDVYYAFKLFVFILDGFIVLLPARQFCGYEIFIFWLNII